MQISRRTFLALSAVVIVGCTSDSDGAADVASDTDPNTTPSDAATTNPAGSVSTDTVNTTGAATTTAKSVIPVLAMDPFTLGVAAGDPDATSVVLWTRLTGGLPAEGIDVVWEIEGLDGSPIGGGVARADASTGGAVHVVAEVSEPVIYRFRVDGYESPEGRAAPVDRLESIRIATATCQHYETGFYAAHRDIAEWSPDLVVFLGDFIYEGAGNPIGDGRVRSHEGPEPIDLDGYRARYATYLADEHLQASRAACPWLVIWDDHEVENNYAGVHPQDPAEATAFPARRAMAYQAWWEHTPTRLPAPDPAAADYPIYRSVDFGDLLTISALDGRQYRSDQVCEATLDVGPPCPGWDDQTRTMLGAEQEAWLAGRFASATSRWNCVAQQTVMTDLRFVGTGGILNYDQWDGYAPARDRVLSGAPPDLIVLTGDIHLAGVGLLGDPTGTTPSGVEFVTTSISSAGDVPADLQPVLAGYANVVDAELTKRGYTRHTITADAWTAEYRTVDDVTDPGSAVSTWKSFLVEHGSPGVTVQV